MTANVATLILALIFSNLAYDYERPGVRLVIALALWAAIRISWWLERGKPNVPVTGKVSN